MIIALQLGCIISTAQGKPKTSYPPYATQIAAIRKEMAAIKDWEGQKNAINNYFARYQAKNLKRPDDVEVFGTMFRLIYRVLYLGYSTQDASYMLANSICFSRIPELKDSIEKDICKAFLGIDAQSTWIFDQFPDWKKSPILTLLCFSTSATSVTSRERYEVLKSAYEPSLQELKSAPSYRQIGVKMALARGSYAYTRDKSYMRQYIDMLREYANQTLDKGSAERSRKLASQYEDRYFKKKGGG